MCSHPAEEHSVLPLLPITYRPPLLMTIGWLLACCVIGVAFFFAFHIELEAPFWALCIIDALVFAAFFSGILTTRMFTTFSNEGISLRTFITQEYNWDDLESWTRWGEDGSTYVRTVDGKVFGFDHWSMTESVNLEVYAILENFLGPETKGDDAVRPAFLKFIMENMIPNDTTPQQ